MCSEIWLSFSTASVRRVHSSGSSLPVRKLPWLTLPIDFSADASRQLREHLYTLTSVLRLSTFSNGRYIRNVIERSIRAHAMRLLMNDQFDRKELMTLRSSDLDFESEEY